MKLLISLSFALLNFSGIALATPVSSFATTNNNNNQNQNHNQNDDKNCNKHPERSECKKEKDDKDCNKHPERNECHVSVPEFGTIPGAIALVSSGGSFLFLKKRY